MTNSKIILLLLAILLAIPYIVFLYMGIKMEKEMNEVFEKIYSSLQDWYRYNNWTDNKIYFFNMIKREEKKMNYAKMLKEEKELMEKVNADEPTEKQLRAVIRIYLRKGVELTEDTLEGLTKGQCSSIIKAFQDEMNGQTNLL